MATWTEDIVIALENLNGIAPLSEIYKEIEKIRKDLPPSYKAIIRGNIESHSSDSEAFKSKDIFYSVEGLGSGIWGLRSSIKNDTPKATDIDISEGEESPERKEQKIYRILRDTKLARQIKQLHNYKCQICSKTIKLSDEKFYAEAHHIIPLGKPHNGSDKSENIIVLCPEHHVMFDYGLIEIDINIIKTNAKHSISQDSIDYHNNEIFGKVIK